MFPLSSRAMSHGRGIKAPAIYTTPLGCAERHRRATVLRVFRWPKLLLKWSLVLLGAWCLLYVYVERFGVYAALWFLLAPVAYGCWSAWPSTRPPSPGPTSTPAWHRYATEWWQSV